MGMSTRNILFFSDEITITPHTATHARHIGRDVSIREFAKDSRVSLEQVDVTGEYIARLPNGDFIHGPEGR